MAGNAEQAKEKKRSAFRSRFLAANSSLEITPASAADVDGGAEGPSTTTGRMRRMLFRRARSETTDRSKPGGSSGDSSVTARQTLPTSATGIQESSVLQPTSPPPPYDTNSEAGSSRSGSICPPSYDEAIASTLAPLPEEPSPSFTYCTCQECQQERFSSPDDDDHDNNSAADAVFPMETHVLMQEVLADGMAFCSVM